MSCKAVAFTRVGGYGTEVEAAVERQFDLLGLEEVFRPGMRVAIKPNLLMKRSPDRFTTTHPDVVRAAAGALRRRGVTDIVLAESPGGPFTRAALEGIYRVCGMEGVGCELNFDTSYGDLACREFVRCSSFHIIRPILEADAVLNLPKLKTHGMTTLSCAVKNLFGCVPGLQKPELHYRYQEELAFCGMLVDLAKALSPAATIVDAVVSMEGDGPSGGTPKRTGFLAGGRNVFAIDAVLAELTGLSPVTTVALSLERGLTPPAEEIELLGQPPEPQRLLRPRTKSLDFFDRLPGVLRPVASTVAQRLAKPRPVVTKRCVGCGKCAESCPAGVIRFEDGRAVIKPEECIRCFCCHEMCPVEAVRIRRFGLFNF